MRTYRQIEGGVDWSVEDDGRAKTPDVMRDRVDHAVRLGFAPRTIEPTWKLWVVENAEVRVWLMEDGGTRVVAHDAIVGVKEAS